MSQYAVTKENGNVFLYGFDAPTGGFFYIEMDTDEGCLHDDDGITLSNLLSFSRKYNVEIYNIHELIMDYVTSSPPTKLQVNVANLFKKEIFSMLDDVATDINENFTNYLGGKNE